MTITIDPPIQRTLTAYYYELGQISDDKDNKVVIAQITTVFGFHNLTLWSGDAYDAIGDWTQQQAQDQIATLLAQQ